MANSLKIPDRLRYLPNLKNFPIIIDNRLYKIVGVMPNDYNLCFLTAFISLVSIFFVLEFVACCVKGRVDKRLNQLLDHMIYLENRSSSPLKLIMMDSYHNVEVHMEGLIDCSKDDTLDLDEIQQLNFRAEENGKYDSYYSDRNSFEESDLSKSRLVNGMKEKKD